jgi:uncharacterized membrane protein
MGLMRMEPLWWLLILLVPMVAIAVSLVNRGDQNKRTWRTWAGGPKGWLSTLCRVLGLVLLVLGLCRPFTTTPDDAAHVNILVDLSESVDLQSARDAVAALPAQLEQLRKKDSWSLYAVGHEVRPYENPGALLNDIDQWINGVQDDALRSGSALGEALLTTRLSFPAGKARRAILLSDGYPTGQALDEVMPVMQQEQISLRYAQLDRLADPEAAVLSFKSTVPTAYVGQVVRLHVGLGANVAMSADLRMLHRGVVVKQMPVTLEAGKPLDVAVDIPMNTPGANVWTAELLPKQDRFPLNNMMRTTVQVKGQPRLLFLHRNPQAMRLLDKALKQQGFAVEVRGEHGLPESLDELLAFDGIIIADLPATDLTERQMTLLKRYVSDFGGGLAMLGSDNSFGLGGYYKTPVEDVLPLVSRYEKEKEKPSLAMVLVIDKSGSMGGIKIDMARQASKAAVELLSGRDQVAVIAFDGQSYVVSEMRYASERDTVYGAIDSIQASGGTNMYPAMAEALKALQETAAKIRHVIVLGDGMSQGGDFEGIAMAMADENITLSTVALGEGADANLMSRMAELGRGRFYQTNDPQSMPRIFTRETMQASKSAIKEDLFAPIVAQLHPMISGFEQAELPYALGYVMAKPKPTARVLLALETGDPLLAVCRYGLGQGVCFTSDLTERWGGEWLAWDDCGKFWAQVFRSMVRASDSTGIYATVENQPDGWLVDLQRSDENNLPLAKVNWDAAVLGDGGQKLDTPVRTVGYGRYQVKVGYADHQTLRLNDQTFDQLKVLHLDQGYPAEYRLDGQPSVALTDVPMLDTHDLRAGLEPIDQRQDIVSLLNVLAMVLLITGILLRRL